LNSSGLIYPEEFPKVLLVRCSSQFVTADSSENISFEVKTGCNLVESSKERYGSKSGVSLLLMMMMMMMIPQFLYRCSGRTA
jgi:hypothetical protein